MGAYKDSIEADVERTMRKQEGEAMLEKDYLTFYYDGDDNQVDVVRLMTPPNEPPRGEALNDLLCEAIQTKTDKVEILINGAVELTAAAWAGGHYREVSIGDSRIASVECSGGEWRVHA